MSQLDQHDSDPPAEVPSVGPATRRRHVWAWLVVGIVGSLGLVAASGVWILANLDHRWVKGSVEGLLSDLIGTDVTYEGLSFSLGSGLEAEDLVIATPEALRAYAPEMLRLDAAAVPIDFRALLGGRVVVPKLRGGALTVTIVRTDDGRDSISELFDATEEPDEPPTPLSRTLESLRGLPITLGPVALAPIHLKAVEVAAGAADESGSLDARAAPAPIAGTITRRSHLGPLGITSDGMSFAEEPTTALSVRSSGDADVVLSVEEPTGAGTTRRARLSLAADLRLEKGRTLALTAIVELHDQSLFPELESVDSLLRLDARADFDPDNAETTAHVAELVMLDDVVVASLHATAHDPVTADDPEPQATSAQMFSVLEIDGEGTIRAPTLPWALETLTVVDLEGAFEIEGLEVRPSGVSAGEARFEASLRSARYDEDPALLELEDGRVRIAISAPADPSQDVGALAIEFAFDNIRARERGFFRAEIDEIRTGIELTGIGVLDSGMWGLQGTGALECSVERIAVRTGDVTAAAKAGVALNLDLAKSRVEGTVPIDYVTWKQAEKDTIRVRGAEIEFAAREPTHWTVDVGTPAIEAQGSVDRVAVGERHFRAPAWALEATRTAPGRFAIDASGTADKVSWGQFAREPSTTFSLEAKADTSRPAVNAHAWIAIAGRAPTTISLKASQDGRRSRYDLDVAGTEAGPLLGALLFGDGGLRSDELSFSLSSQGAFRGLASKNQNGELVLSKEPARTLRGSHRTELQVDHLALLRFDLTHQVHDLTVLVASSHESPGRGALDVTTRFGRALYGEREQPMSLHDYAQELRVAYGALHGAPSFVIETDGTLGKFDQPYMTQYPVANVSFGVDLDVDDTQVYAIREMYWHNPAGGTRFDARASYEGWSDAIRSTDVCAAGTMGCPEVPSMYGREAAKVTGTFEQDFSFWRSTERTKSGGSLSVPFTIESGDLNTYRVLATAQLRDVVLEIPQYGVLVENLDALIPMDQEFATEPEFFVVPSRAANAMAQKRFFDLYPFTGRDSFFTVDRVQLGPEIVGPVAANLHVMGSAIAMDQIHAAYRGGFITGQFLADLNRDDPEVAFRGHITGVKVEDGKGVFDANLAMTFVPTTLIIEGKAQVVRISKDHLYAILDVLDPYHEDEDINRVRLGLKFGYPKYVRVNFDEGLMDTLIDLGGLAGAVRIDEIKGIPVTPFLEQYVQPYIERVFTPSLMYEETPPEMDTEIQVSERSGG